MTVTVKRFASFVVSCAIAALLAFWYDGGVVAGLLIGAAVGVPSAMVDTSLRRRENARRRHVVREDVLTET